MVMVIVMIIVTVTVTVTVTVIVTVNALRRACKRSTPGSHRACAVARSTWYNVLAYYIVHSIQDAVYSAYIYIYRLHAICYILYVMYYTLYNTLRYTIHHYTMLRCTIVLYGSVPLYGRS